MSVYIVNCDSILNPCLYFSTCLAHNKWLVLMVMCVFAVQVNQWLTWLETAEEEESEEEDY